MERLTERDEFGNADIIGVDSADLQLNLEFDDLNRVTDALNRLAAYEDTGLTPEEIESRKEKWNAMTMRERLDSVAKPAQLFDPSLTLEQLKRLDYYDNAEQEGRLVVLPCKVGDVVYELDRRILQVYRIIPPSAAFIMSEIENGIEFYKTREEAEAALKGVSEDA